jgi:acetyl-CoA carboxylase carboxyl transferase subunit alpha
MSYSARLDFERDYLDLENKIEELKSFASQKNINLEAEITAMEARLLKLKEEKFHNLTAWQRYQIARHPDRPTSLDYMENIFDDFIELHGDRCYGDDSAIVGGLARFNGIPVTVIGHQRGKDTNQNLMRNFGMPHPEGYRKAYRLMEQSEKFGRPLVCLVDTQGAYPGPMAEERGQGWAIARAIAFSSRLKIPVVSIVIGEGGSGGALALGVADRLLMLSYATYSVISPYGCASILLNDSTRAQETAEDLKMTAGDLLALGIVDEIIPEPLEGAHHDTASTFAAVAARLSFHLNQLMERDPQSLVEERYRSLRKIGMFLET